ncbi:hypothetical protein KW786_03240 [Candidatus Parcubacteria bacterium]|nr:hypothetical protein [Candidatus Parcubacteria bacterium]
MQQMMVIKALMNGRPTKSVQCLVRQTNERRFLETLWVWYREERSKANNCFPVRIIFIDEDDRQQAAFLIMHMGWAINLEDGKEIPVDQILLSVHFQVLTRLLYEVAETDDIPVEMPA